MSVLVAMQQRHGTAFIAMSLFCYVRNVLNTVILYQMRIAYNFAFFKLEIFRYHSASAILSMSPKLKFTINFPTGSLIGHASLQ